MIADRSTDRKRPAAFAGAGLAVAVLSLAIASCGTEATISRDDGAAPPRSALLITIDTLRADQLHSYGYPGNSSPNMDALAVRGALFENAIAAASVTAPAHASIMTSRFVRGHSIGSSNGGTRLDDAPTLAGSFRGAGYETAAFVGNWVLLPRIGLDSGFDRYDAELPDQELNRPHLAERIAEQTTQRALRWLAEPRDGPFFLWVHLQDPHGPYTPPPTWQGRFQDVQDGVTDDGDDRELEPLPFHSGRGGIPAYQIIPNAHRLADFKARYIEEVAYADEWIGRLVAAAEDSAGDRGLAVVLTADHGESLGEGGYFFQHGHTITPELARVPFIAVAPGIAATRRTELVHHIDVMPTLLELAGVDVPPGATGTSLGPVLRGEDTLPDRVVFSDIGRELGVYRGDEFLRVVGSPDFWGDWAGGRGSAGSPPDSLLAFEAFTSDGRLARSDPDPALRAAVEAYLKEEVPMLPAAALSDEDEERLRALGYLEPAEEASADGEPDQDAPADGSSDTNSDEDALADEGERGAP